MSQLGDCDSLQSRRFLIQMPGAPKSTTSRLLVSLIDAVVIDHDVIRSSLLEGGIPFELAARTAYRLNWALAEDFIKQGKSLVIYSTCNYQETVDHGRSLAQRYDYEYWYIECRTDDIDLLDQRLRNKSSLKSQRKGVYQSPLDVDAVRSDDDCRALFKRWIESPCRPDSHVILLDSASDADVRSQHILTQLALQNDTGDHDTSTVAREAAQGH